uniref:Peroxisomal ATPase PEX1 n=1 Tax=Strigamia maritima TaxID=126957 RepID=T1IN76_STRMM
MEMQRAAIIQCSTKKTCFISIPASWTLSSLSEQTVLEVEHGDRQKAYFTWSGETAKQRDKLLNCNVVEISGHYAKNLNILHGEQVLIKELNGVSVCKQVWVIPLSQQDLEIIELNANLVQNQLLNQNRVVWKNQVMPVWINKSVIVHLRVVDLSVASDIGLLVELTEIHVQDTTLEATSNMDENVISTNSLVQTNTNSKVENNLQSVAIPIQNDTKSQKTSGILNWMVKCIAEISDIIYDTREPNLTSRSVRRNSESDKVQNDLMSPFEFNASFRVHPIPELDIDKIEEPEIKILLRQPTNVYIFADNLPKTLSVSALPPFFICRLIKILSPHMMEKKHGNNKSNEEKQTSSVFCGFVKVVLVDRLSLLSLHWSNIPMNNAVSFIPNSLRRHFGLEISSKVRLEAKVFRPKQPISVSIHLLNHDFVELVESEEILVAVANVLPTISSSCVPLVANNGTMLPLKFKENSFDVLLSFNNISSSSLVMFDASSVKGSVLYGISAVELAKSADDIKLPQFSHVKNLDFSFVFNKTDLLGGVLMEIQSGIEFLQLSLGLGYLSSALGNSSCDKSGALLVTGNRGSGKTSVARAICGQLSQIPFWVFVNVINCKTQKGKRVESIYDEWKKALVEAKFRAPSILLLDDLDVICGFSSSIEDNAVNAYSERIAQALLKLTSSMISSQVTLLVTAASKQSLHPILTNPKGRHFFHKSIIIPTLDHGKRVEILDRIICDFLLDSDASLKAINLKEIATRMEGGVARDLRLVLDRAVHSACTRLRTDCSNVVLDQSDFECALDGFTPSALKGMSCHGESSKSWHDVGGLEQVKKVLREIFLWPTKYPKLFANSPLQLSSGVLLYGPPGTGKTLLASIVAKESSLNFISIKGPELLSKYIGASEQAVRDLFLRAQAARPSVIFFDEFDALAPRRGHDSTGVTDRVVNQLLTQLDGIEGRQGVYILAATSRPDLIDPALLRPGRLDKCLHCPLPTKEELVEILKVLARSMTNLDVSTVDLERVVGNCDHFSGADVQSLLYSAQLMAIHSSCDAPSVIIPRASDTENEVWAYCPALEDGFVSNIPESRKNEIFQQLELITRRTVGPQYGLSPMSEKEENQFKRQVVVVTEEMLLDATKQTKPSVSASERQKYQIIYEHFMKSRGGFGEKKTANNMQQKATLA